MGLPLSKFFDSEAGRITLQPRRIQYYGERSKLMKSEGHALAHEAAAMPDKLRSHRGHNPNYSDQTNAGAEPGMSPGEKLMAMAKKRALERKISIDKAMVELCSEPQGKALLNQDKAARGIY